MSHDLTLWISGGGDDRHAVYDWNVTYNYQPVFEAAGMRSLANLSGLRADVASKVVDTVYANIHDLGPDRVNELVRGGGEWGNYNDLVAGLMTLAMKLHRNPSAFVEVN